MLTVVYRRQKKRQCGHSASKIITRFQSPLLKTLWYRGKNRSSAAFKDRCKPSLSCELVRQSHPINHGTFTENTRYNSATNVDKAGMCSRNLLCHQTKTRDNVGLNHGKQLPTTTHTKSCDMSPNERIILGLCLSVRLSGFVRPPVNPSLYHSVSLSVSMHVCLPICHRTPLYVQIYQMHIMQIRDHG